MAGNTVGSFDQIRVLIAGAVACGIPGVGVATEPPTRLDDVGVWPVFGAMMDTAIVHDHAASCRKRVGVRGLTFIDTVLCVGRSLNLKLLGLGCEPADWEDDWKDAHDLVLAIKASAVLLV